MALVLGLGHGLGVSASCAFGRPAQRRGAQAPLYDQTFQRAFKRAVQSAGISKPATSHTLRHAFADVATTMIYTHVLKVGGGGARSPLDSMPA